MSASPSLHYSLRQSYQRGAWQEIVHSIFPFDPKCLFEIIQPLEATHELIKSTNQIGLVHLPDGKTIALLEIETSNQVKLARNRVGLRNFVSSFIDEAGASAVLAVFHQAATKDWRLTYAARQTTLDEETFQPVTIETAPRRFTFVLGPNEPCRTASSRLASIREKGDKLTLIDVEKAFSVESLSKEFFDKYRAIYRVFVAHLLPTLSSLQEAQAEKYRALNHLLPKPDASLAAKTRKTFAVPTHEDIEVQDKADKPVRDFIKTLLGRLVFLHFLQKKGWLGCEAGSEAWTGGDMDFLRSLFTLATSRQNAAAFHSKYLGPLFFEALNSPDRPHQIFPLTGSRIPYLNGGLFDEDSGPLRALDFPPELFTSLLDFFGEYNFTIDENDPEDHEVGIDPEMLGHIFENQLEDNKEKGAYYTPKPSVTYMARESLRHYLESHLGHDPEIATLLNEKDLTRLAKGGFVHQHAKDIAVLLENVKVCDPAIGSGAFPIGLLQEILWTRLALNWELNTPTQRAKLKRQIIQNSIHGVDLDPGAVEIARLRFWLALVVDEDEPRPLPNLDYKIMQGNSLLESFAGIDLSRISSGEQPSMAITQLIGTSQSEFSLDEARSQMELQVGQRRETITKLLRDYFSETNPATKKQRHTQIDAQVIAHLEHAIAWERERIGGLLDQQQKMLAGKIARTRAWTAAKATRQIAAYQSDLTALSEKQTQLLALQASATRPFFLWHLFFQDVFANGGFDIVIANPPYVRHELIKDQKPLLQAEGYQCATGTADLFVYFYEQAINLLKPKGVLTFITSNKYYRVGYGEKLRAYLAKELTLHTLIDFRDAPIFNDVIAYASILIGQKQPCKADHNTSCLLWDLTRKAAELPQEIKKAFPVRQSTLTPDGWRLVSPQVNVLLIKLRTKGTPLGEYVNGRFYYGIKTGYNEAFVIDGQKRSELIASDPKSEEIIKPFLRGRDVKRWQATHADYWLIKIESSANAQHPWTDAKDPEAVFRQAYPAVCKWLFSHRRRLVNRDDQGTYFWELRSCAYWEDFEASPKIIYPDIYEHQSFTYDTQKMFCANTAYFIPMAEKWCCPLLNSNLIEWLYGMISNRARGGYLRAFSDYIRQIPIPPSKDTDKTRLSELSEACAVAANKNDIASLTVLEAEINQIVYRLFDLTPEEIALIESSLQS